MEICSFLFKINMCILKEREIIALYARFIHECFYILAKCKRDSRVLFSFSGYERYIFHCDFFFHYDVVLISLNDKIIRYTFQAKNQMFLFYFNYLEVL